MWNSFISVRCMGILRCTILLLSLSAVCLPAYGRHDEPAASAGTDSPAGPAVEEMRRQRGLVDISHVFVPEGQWIFGGTASYSAHANDDYTFFIVEKINSDGYTFKVSPLIGYALRNNMALGMRFVYGRSLLKVDSGELNLGDEESGTHLTAEYYYSLKHSYSAAAIWRQYIPLGRNRRIALFNEMSLTLGGHQKKFAADSPVRGTYETGYSVSLGVSPGLIAFATNTMAVEVNVGVMGLSYTHAPQPGPGGRCQVESYEFQDQPPVDRTGCVILSVTVVR